MARARVNRVSVGEKIDIHLGKGPYYRTVVGEVLPNKVLLVPLPTFRGIPIILRNEQELKIYFYRDNGRFVQSVKVVGFDLASAVRMVKLKELSEPERQQRRETFRVSTILRAYIRPFELGPFPEKIRPSESVEMEETPTFNISATGVSLRTKHEYEQGDRVFMRIFLAWPKVDSDPLHILGEIRQVARIEPDRNIFQLGVMFTDVSVEMSTHIAKFVLVEEQRRVQKMKLLEDDD